MVAHISISNFRLLVTRSGVKKFALYIIDVTLIVLLFYLIFVSINQPHREPYDPCDEAEKLRPGTSAAIGKHSLFEETSLDGHGHCK